MQRNKSIPQRVHISLANGCHRTEFKVSPANWQTKRASINKDWYIWYRFTDPKYIVDYPHGKLVVVKGMNSSKELIARQQDTIDLLAQELSLLDHQNYNPITKLFTSNQLTNEIDEYTELNKAITWAKDNAPMADGTRVDCRHIVEHFKVACEKLKLNNMPISEVRRSDIRKILSAIGVVKGEKWTANNFNYFRANLGILFNYLQEFDAIEINPVLSIRKKKVVKKIRTELTTTQRKQINRVIKRLNYNFWRFIHVFFHSGSRITELMRLKYEDVDITRQRVKVLIMKGGLYIEKWKPIKNSVLPLWIELMKSAKPGGYIFSKMLEPGNTHIAARQISIRWRRWVKEKLGIPVNFYTLKHTNATEMMDNLNETVSIEEAEKIITELTGHTTPEMVRAVYDLRNKTRKDELIKKAQNKFA